jgi:hypothetical protein
MFVATIAVVVCLTACSSRLQTQMAPASNSNLLGREVYLRSLEAELKFWLKRMFISRREWLVQAKPIENTDGIIGISFSFADDPEHPIAFRNAFFHGKAKPEQDAWRILHSPYTGELR